MLSKQKEEEERVNRCQQDSKIFTMDPSADCSLIQKETLHPGRKYIPLKPGTRVKFHFQTIKHDGTQTILDDSRELGRPMELVLGKKFKLEVWEVMVQKMALNEVARFTVDKTLVLQYPFISKTLRDVGKKQEERKHCCGMTIQSEGIGYKDLDELLNRPCDLQFIFELISVEHPDEYQKESWQLTDDEKLNAIRELRDKGNASYKDKDIVKAEECYTLALGMLEQLMLKEKPNDVEWLELAKLKIPFLLNYAQCRLLNNDYYPVIEYCTEVLKYEPTNVKALFRRGKAHIGAWNPNEAKADFEKCMELDQSLTPIVSKELKSLNEELKIRDLEDKVKFTKMF